MNRATRSVRAAIVIAASMAWAADGAPTPASGSAAWAQEKSRRGAESAAGPCASLSVLVGCPTDRSATLSVLSETDLDVRIEYGASRERPASTTPVGRAPARGPYEVDLSGLAPDSKVFYRVRVRRPGDADFVVGAEGAFRTQRAPGSAFSFALQGDSHPERLGKMFDPRLYERTLRAAAAGSPDFYVLLGDDFSIDPLISRGGASQSTVDRVYAHQRTFLGLVGATSPLFLVNGNHEQAARYLLDGTAENPAIWAGRARISHYPLPVPGPFYSGNMEEVPHLGLPRDYYAWTWGDALFVAIDPYWHSASAVDNVAGQEGGARGEKGGKAEGGGKGGNGKAARDMWSVGLGDAQYAWLKATLEGSRARWKFVFAHHVLGTGRGGIEQAGLYEWGGKDRGGDDSFAEKRPGWELPIHALFVKTGVTVFFQGHDHLFARQELDGVVYQSTPNPADATYTAFNRESYRSGDVLPNSGHLRVTVRHEDVRVEYIRSVLPGEESRAGAKDGEVAFAYTVAPRAQGRK